MRMSPMGDWQFRNWAYTIVSHYLSMPEKKELFTQKELSNISYGKSMRSYFHTCPIDTIHFALAKIGITRIELYGPDVETITEAMQATHQQYQHEQKQTDATVFAAENFVFAIGDRENVIMANFLSYNSRTKLYDIVLSGKAIGDFHSFSNRIPFTDRSFYMKMDNIEKGMGDMSWYLSALLNSEEWLMNQYHLSIHSMSILLLYYVHRHGVLTMEDAQIKSGQNHPNNKFVKHFNKLVKKDLIQSTSPVTPGREYYESFMITSAGIRVVVAYGKYIFEQKISKKQ